MTRKTNYSYDRDSEENFNIDEKYSVTGESEYSRDSTIPFDQDEVLSVRNYNLGDHSFLGKKVIRNRVETSRSNLIDHRGKGPKGYSRADSQIKEDVCEALYRSSVVDASEMLVRVEKGHVILQGFAQNRDQKKFAEETIEHVPGVVDVFNELLLKSDRPLSTGEYGLINNITGLN